jgi:hypothetical protein
MVRRERFFRRERSSVLGARVQDRPSSLIGRRAKQIVLRDIVPRKIVPGETVPGEREHRVRGPRGEVPREVVRRLRAV